MASSTATSTVDSALKCHSPCGKVCLKNGIVQIELNKTVKAPIDPHQLLKALDNHLSPTGGIKSIKDVPRLASLMKKFSKKLVSRCVYSNVLQATEPDILSEYLDKGGWETINLWLQYAKSSSSHSFLLEILILCKQLPMTLDRLKENNTAKVIKSLTKHENSDVKTLSTELVTKWMTIIKGKKAAEIETVEKKKKKSKHDTEKSSESKSQAKSESPKGAGKIKGTKRPSSEKPSKKEEFYEDVKIDPEPLLPPPKKAKPDRPKTAKIFQKKFRATGLEEETPLPKNISKKTSTVDKTTVAAAKNAIKSIPIIPERVTEKKIKPENLMAINENSTSNKGIKLIPAKPRPSYVLHESASFMDALISQPVVPVKRRKKAQPPKSANSPTSPTLVPPKLQFYKDTLETSEDNKKEESEKENVDAEITKSEAETEEASVGLEGEDEPMEITTEEGGRTPPNDEVSNSSNINEDMKELELKENSPERQPFDPNHLRSILSHGRRRSHKKSVKWVEDADLKEVFYFELDETERVNVLRTQNFGDLKSIELKREREAIEQAKRQSGDRMEEMIRWWMFPVIIDLPPPLIEPGCQSREREIERSRQQLTLQEIYFTKEMIPDSPHEPDLEIVPPQEPKIIPLDEDNTIGSLMDYSHMEFPKPVLPDVLSSLMKLNPSRTLLPIPNNIQEQIPNDHNLMTPPLMNSDAINQLSLPMSLSQPYDPAEPVSVMPPNSLLGPPPGMQNAFNMTPPPDSQNLGPGPQGEWQPTYYGSYQMNSAGADQIPGLNQGPGGMNQSPVMNQGPGMNQGSNMNQGPGMDQGHGMRPRMMQDNYRPPHKGPPRGMAPRPRNAHRVPCRHFIANGCRFGMKCTFLHPGVNGPRL